MRWGIPGELREQRAAGPCRWRWGWREDRARALSSAGGGGRGASGKRSSCGPKRQLGPEAGGGKQGPSALEEAPTRPLSSPLRCDVARHARYCPGPVTASGLTRRGVDRRQGLGSAEGPLGRGGEPRPGGPGVGSLTVPAAIRNPPAAGTLPGQALSHRLGKAPRSFPFLRRDRESEVGGRVAFEEREAA